MLAIQSKWISLTNECDQDGYLTSDCSAQYVIDTDMLSHTVHATRPIEEGEEITISCKLERTSDYCQD